MSDSVKIPRDLRSYDEEVAGVFTSRQLIFLLGAGIPAFLVYTKVPGPSWLKLFGSLAVLVAAFAAALVSRDGYSFEQLLSNRLTYRLLPGEYHSSVHYEGRLTEIKRALRHLPGAGSRVLPVEAIDGSIVHTGKGLVSIIKVDFLNSDLMDSDESETAISSFRELLHALSDGYPLQLLVRVRHFTLEGLRAQYADARSKLDDPELVRLLDVHEEFVRSLVADNSISTREGYIVVPLFPEKPPPRIGGNLRFLWDVAMARKTDEEKMDPEELASALKSRRETIRAAAEGVGLNPQLLDSKEALQLLYDFYNPPLASGGTVASDLSSVAGSVSDDNLADFLLPERITVTKDTLGVGAQDVSVYRVTDFPGTVGDFWLKRVTEVESDLDLVIHISPVESSTAVRILSRTLAKVQASIQRRRDRGRVVDFEAQVMADDIGETQKSLARNDEQFFLAGIYLGVRAPAGDRKEMDSRCRLVRSALETHQAHAEPATRRHLDGFLSLLPLGTDMVQRLRTFNTSSLATCMPFCSPSMTDPDGILYGVNTANSSIVSLSRFNREADNYNCLVLATSGAGKSFHTKIEAFQYYCKPPTRIFLIDPESEYEKLTEAVGGAYINLTTADPPIHLNPLDPYLATYEKKYIDDQVARSCVLLSLMAGRDLTGRERNAGENALYALYDGDRVPILSDLYAALEGELPELAADIKPWVTGSRANLFNHPTDCGDLSRSRWVAFGINELSEEMRTVAMFVLLNWIWVMIDRAKVKVPTLLYIDEGYTLLDPAYEQSAAFMDFLCRQARKRYLGITFTEHRIDKLTEEGSRAKSIIDTAEMMILFRMKKSGLNSLEKVIPLSDRERNILLSGKKKGYGVIYRRGEKAPFRVVAPQEFEDEFLTTNPVDLYRGEKIA